MGAVVGSYEYNMAEAEGILWDTPKADNPIDTELVIAAREGLGRKFTGADIADGGETGTELYDIAAAWLPTQADADFAWLADLAKAYARGGGLTDRQAAGVLNCLVAQINRVQQPTPIRPTSLRGFDTDEDDNAYDAWIEHEASTVSQGYYTVVLSDRRVTIKLGKWQEDRRRSGEIMRWVSFFSGSDNYSDYTSFAIQHGDGSHRIMPAFRTDHGHLNTALNVLLQGGAADAREAYALESGCCARCNRLLTVPASIYRGLGPECAKKV